MRAIIIDLLGNDTYEILKKNKCIIAGGALRSIFNNTEINDFDIYFQNKEYFNMVKDYFYIKYHNNFDYSSNSSITFKIKNKQVQLLRPYFGKPHKIISHFDFNVVKAFFNISNNKYYYSKEFIEGNKKMLIKFNKSYRYYFSCFHRILKYKTKYGYKFDKSFFKILNQKISNIHKLNNLEDIKKFINGEDYKTFDLMLEMFSMSYDNFTKDEFINNINDFLGKLNE